MDIESESKMADRFQHFYETGFLIIGFAACFSWEGAIELKVILSLILIRVCFSWGELSAIEKKIKAYKYESLRSTAVLQGFIISIKEEVARGNDPTRKDKPASEIAEEYQKTIERSGNSFDDGYGMQLRIEGLDQQVLGSSVLPLVIGVLGQVSLAAFIGWGISFLL